MDSNTTNNILLQQLSAGDEPAFAYLYHKYHNAVLANICKLVSYQHEAEDILQEVFITLWQNRQQLTKDQSLAGWLFTTSYYKSLEHLRKSIRQSFQTLDEQVVLMETDNSADFEKEYAEKLTVLNAAIENLPPRKKSAFTLCRLEGKTYKEAALELGLSEETVKDYVKTSAKMLKEYIVAQNPAMSAISAGCLVVFLQL